MQGHIKGMKKWSLLHSLLRLGCSLKHTHHTSLLIRRHVQSCKSSLRESTSSFDAFQNPTFEPGLVNTTLESKDAFAKKLQLK